MVEDLQLEALQLGSGVEAELLGQRGAGRRQRAHGVGLAAGPVLGQGQLAPAALAQRLLGHRLLETPDDGAVAAEGQLGVEAVFHDGGPALLESHDHRLDRDLAGQPGEGRAPPEGEGFVEAVEGGGDVARLGRPATLLGQRLEAEHVDGVALDPQEVAGRLRRQDPGRAPGGAARFQSAPKAGDVALEGAEGGGRRLVAPHAGDEAIDGHHPARFEHQVGQHGPLLGAAELERVAVAEDLERTEQAERERARRRWVHGGSV